MQILRTFFKKEIFAEVAVPARPSQRVVIICNGVPSVPSKRTLMDFLSKKGYWVVHMRYRGSWESKGAFLKKSLERDILDIINELPRGFRDIWTKRKYRILAKKIIVIGASFGGPAVIRASQDSRVTKAIAVSPVVDWHAPSPDEPLPKFVRFLKTAYVQAYRTTLWHKLGHKGFYEPDAKVTDGGKLMIIHARDDRIMRLKEVKQFAQKTKATFLLRAHGGHFSGSIIMEPDIWRRVVRFVRT